MIRFFADQPAHISSSAAPDRVRSMVEKSGPGPFQGGRPQGETSSGKGVSNFPPLVVFRPLIGKSSAES